MADRAWHTAQHSSDTQSNLHTRTHIHTRIERQHSFFSTSLFIELNIFANSLSIFLTSNFLIQIISFTPFSDENNSTSFLFVLHMHKRLTQYGYIFSVFRFFSISVMFACDCNECKVFSFPFSFRRNSIYSR